MSSTCDAQLLLLWARVSTDQRGAPALIGGGDLYPFQKGCLTNFDSAHQP
jgi:hypothetical protein